VKSRKVSQSRPTRRSKKLNKRFQASAVRAVATTVERARQFGRLLLAFRDLVRWGAWYYSKIPLFFVGMSYATLRMPQPGAAQAAQMAALFVLLCLYAAFGHIVNDYADREIDRAAGKRKLLATWSERQALIAVAIPCIGTVAVALICFDASTIVVTMIAVLVAALYSLPPVRLKECGVLGWVAAAVAQRTLPVAIIFEALKAWDVVAVGFTILNTFIGLRWIILHQLEDFQNDRRSGVRTVATQQPPERLVAVSHILFTVELASACGVVAAMSYFIPSVGLTGFAYAVGRGSKPLSPVSYYEFHDFYCVVWPITVAVLLASWDPVFLSMLFLAVTFVEPNLRLKFQRAFAGFTVSLKEAVQRELFPRLFAMPSPTLGAQAGSTRKVEIDKADPYPAYARLRGIGPVLKLDCAGIGPTWVVLCYREAITVFTDSHFVRNADEFAVASGGGGPQQLRRCGDGSLELKSADPHKFFKLVRKAFTPRILQQLSERIEQMADQILRRGRSRGGIELMSEYASIVPVRTIAELLGLPLGDFAKFHAFIHSFAFHHILGRESSDLEAARSRFTDELHALFAARRAVPQDDLLTSLIHLEQRGKRLSDEELSGIIYSLLMGGVTTSNVIGNGMLALLRHPEQLELLRQNPSLAEKAVEEMLRFDSPIELSAICLPSTQVELGGVRIPGGTPIRVLIPSANRDERQFPAPNMFDITRNPCPQLCFRQGMQHRLAAPLIRFETKVAVRMLVDCAPKLRLDDPLQIKWAPHPILHALQRLPLRL
jgi:cytochrome P450/4-hydroxybenzoate polyprenyltransferase